MRHAPTALLVPALLCAALVQPALAQQSGGDALREALLALASEAPPSWDAVQQASGLDLRPADGYGPYRFGRQAGIVLDGFGEVVLPDGNVGADAGTRTGNEGEANFLLAGTEDEVWIAALNKFYARPNYAEVLRDQILPADILVRRDGDCSPDAPVSETEPTLFWLVLDGADLPLSVSVSMEDGGRYGPGNTFFEFRRGGASVEIPVC
jgi:hypothetical protein